MFLFTVSGFVQQGIAGSEKANFIQDFDQDQDGKISKEEFRGSDQDFNRLEKNGISSIKIDRIYPNKKG